ncbi:head GIN domain-containing protein [Sphingobacterium pedocola]|uniref:DUF2807 domain-containing protein n=1 Tax=Sphingobacterium pedocola TaxID=2082722 RepID=A0ABR9T7D2_9SPHI|nr:head GIN domain-containing protein [Sphingobacterium pedocola]MBE8721260.1 DUF2807 domain-containing protein [Sphingobacterium pedocola]
MMYRIVFAAALIVLMIQTGFSQLSRSIGAIRQLDVTDKINVILIPNDKNEVVITGELANQVEVIETNGTLRIKMTSGYLLKGDQAEVTVYTPTLNTIAVRKGAHVQMEHGEIQTDSLVLTANEGAKLNLVVRVDFLESYSTSGSTIDLSGEATKQEANIAFGGTYIAKDLHSDDAYARVNAGGRCEINAKQSVDVQTRAGGVIDIYGNPAERKQRKLAGGKINFLSAP